MGQDAEILQNKPHSSLKKLGSSVDLNEHLNRFDAIVEKLQNETDKSKIPDLVDKLIDAQYLSFSMIDYTQHIIDQKSAQSASKHFNSFISHGYKKPEDLLITLLLSLLMISFAISASSLVNNKKAQKAYKNTRRILSGLKNGRHAFVDIYFLLTPFIHAHYNIANPIGIAAGVLLAPALVAYSYFDEKRNKMIQDNENIIDKLVRHYDFEEEIIDQQIFYDPPQTRGKLHNAAMLGLSIFDGVTDGAYMFGAIVQTIGGYSGFAGLSAVTGGTAAIVLLSIIAAYTVMSMISSIFVEYDRQKKLQKSADEASIAQLQYLQGAIKKKKTELLRQESILLELRRKPFNLGIAENQLNTDQINMDIETTEVEIKNINNELYLLKHQRDKLSDSLIQQYKIDTNQKLDDTLIRRFEKKYEIKYGETASRSRLAKSMELFEDKMDTLIGHDTKNKTQSYFNEFLARERDFKTAHPKFKNKKICTKLLDTLENQLNLKKLALETAKAERKSTQLQFIYTPTGSAIPIRDSKDHIIDELSQEVQLLTDQIQDIKTILELKNRANIRNNPLQENKLRYKTYCTELIAAEKKLFKNWKQTKKTPDQRLLDVKNDLKERDEKCSPYNYYKRKQLKNEQKDLLAHQAAIHRVSSTREKIIILIMIGQLECLNLNGDDKKSLEEIKSTLTSPQNDSTTCLNLLDPIGKALILQELYNRYSQQINDTSTRPQLNNFLQIKKQFDDIDKEFEEIHKAQIEHLKEFEPRAPENNGHFVAFWRSVRGFFSGFKNTNKIIDTTITSPIMSGAGIIAKKVVKNVAVPAVLAYSHYVAKQEEKRYKPKRRGSPRLFSELRVEKEDLDIVSSATLNPV